jgi:hypothetical protein
VRPKWYFKALFGLQRKVEGKKVRGKNVKGMKVSRKWVESEIILLLFGMMESEKKVRGKKDVCLIK